MSKKEVKLKGVMSIDEVATNLEDMAKSLKDGKICVRQDEQFVTLCTDQMVDVEVKAAAKKGGEKLEMELSWRREVPQEMDISSDDPEQEIQAKSAPPAVSGPAIEIPEAQDEDKVDQSQTSSAGVERHACRPDGGVAMLNDEPGQMASPVSVPARQGHPKSRSRFREGQGRFEQERPVAGEGEWFREWGARETGRGFVPGGPGRGGTSRPGNSFWPRRWLSPCVAPRHFRPRSSPSRGR